MNLKKEQPYLIGMGVTLLAWYILYSMLVGPAWTERKDKIDAANLVLGELEKQETPKPSDPKSKDRYVNLAEGKAQLAKEEERQNKLMADLRKLEFAIKLPEFSAADIKSGEDPKNYFDKKRRDALESIQREGTKVQPNLLDLGIRGPLTEEPVPLNLARLFILKQFMSVARKAGATELVAISYARPFFLRLPEDPAAVAAPVESTPAYGRRRDDSGPVSTKEKEKEVAAAPPQLAQVPLLVRVQIPERGIAPLLAALQEEGANGKDRFFFSLRNFQVLLQKSTTGLVDAEFAFGALFSEEVATALQLGVRKDEDPRASLLRGGALDPDTFSK